MLLVVKYVVFGVYLFLVACGSQKQNDSQRIDEIVKARKNLIKDTLAEQEKSLIRSMRFDVVNDDETRRKKGEEVFDKMTNTYVGIYEVGKTTLEVAGEVVVGAAQVVTSREFQKGVMQTMQENNKQMAIDNAKMGCIMRGEAFCEDEIIEKCKHGDAGACKQWEQITNSKKIARKMDEERKTEDEKRQREKERVAKEEKARQADSKVASTSVKSGAAYCAYDPNNKLKCFDTPAEKKEFESSIKEIKERERERQNKEEQARKDAENKAAQAKADAARKAAQAKVDAEAKARQAAEEKARLAAEQERAKNLIVDQKKLTARGGVRPCPGETSVWAAIGKIPKEGNYGIYGADISVKVTCSSIGYSQIFTLRNVVGDGTCFGGTTTRIPKDFPCKYGEMNTSVESVNVW